MSERKEYTPTMDEVRQGYVYGAAPLPAYYSKDHPVALQVHGEQFDAWLAAHDLALREQIADDLRIEALNDDPETPNAYREGIRDGLMRGVDIARGEDQTDE